MTGCAVCLNQKLAGWTPRGRTHHRLLQIADALLILVFPLHVNRAGPIVRFRRFRIELDGLQKRLERTIGLIRDFPGLTVTDIALMRSDIGPGRYTLRITVKPDRLRGFTYADNRGTGSVGHSRVYNSLSASSIAIPGDELRLDLFAMPGGHSRYLYGQALAMLPLGRDGLRLTVSGSRGDQSG